jgi:hypothetical protein
VWASVLTGECRNLDFRPSFGLTSPPTAETAEPFALSILIPSASVFLALDPATAKRVPNSVGDKGANRLNTSIPTRLTRS